MSFKKTLIKASSFKTPSRRSVASDLKLTLIRASHECSQGFGADEFKSIVEEFIAQFGESIKDEPKQVVKKADKKPNKAVEKASDTSNMDDLLT